MWYICGVKVMVENVFEVINALTETKNIPKLWTRFHDLNVKVSLWLQWWWWSLLCRYQQQSIQQQSRNQPEHSKWLFLAESKQRTVLHRFYKHYYIVRVSMRGIQRACARNTRWRNVTQPIRLVNLRTRTRPLMESVCGGRGSGVSESRPHK